MSTEQKAPVMPVIRGLSGKVMALERRRDFLCRQIASGRGSAGSLEFSRAEREALEAGIDALTYHRAVVNGLDIPLGILRELVETCQSGAPAAELLERAKLVLDEYGA